MESNKKKLSIVQVATFFAPVVGGVETQVEDLSRQLIALGHEVEVFTTDASRSTKRLTRKEDDYEGLKVKRSRVWFSLSQFHRFTPGIFALLMKKDFDVVHVHGIRKIEMYFALLAAKLKRKKVIASTHNPFTTVERSIFMRLIIFLHDITFGILLMRFVDSYLLLSSDEIPILKKFGIKEDQMLVVGNAVDERFFERNQIDKSIVLERLGINAIDYERVILAVGRLNYVKGFQNLLQAAKDMPKNLFLIVGGDDGYLEVLKSVFAECQNVVITAGFLNRDQLREIYRIADVFVLPSLHEPFGIVLLEAMASGVPVVASSNGGPRDILLSESLRKKLLDIDFTEKPKGVYGLVQQPTDQELLSKNISSLLLDPELAQHYAQQSLKRARDYTWKAILPKYLEVYGG